MAKISLTRYPTPIEAGRRTVLETALAADIPFPHGCRIGECGQCKCRLLAGEVAHDPHDPAALSAAERAVGLILACRARPRTDVRIDWPSTGLLPVRRTEAEVVAVERLAHDVVKLTLALPGEPLVFLPGQYARLGFGRLALRAYSMANLPGAARLEFHLRELPGGAASGYAAHQLQIGERVRFEGPFGDAYLREDHAGPIVAVAGGTGLAPVLSIVRALLAREPECAVALYFGVRDVRDAYAADVLAELAAAHRRVRVHVVLSAPTVASPHRTGLVHEALAADAPELSAVYLAGPPAMVAATRAVALRLGVAADAVHADPFTPSAEPVAPPTSAWRRWFARLLGQDAGVTDHG